ncbi:hypothetical protein IE4872_PC00377 (plasmid) [Rhizobium gallicum]|uniref:Uncharacterized protein n=1 Tax=Rhizobium gallicum TaxID=56730 RepID=A0A1L5NR93_9HYPH|nr:hypothetical protein IE4872_PC00377 [Rhizobium gallicum]
MTRRHAVNRRIYRLLPSDKAKGFIERALRQATVQMVPSSLDEYCDKLWVSSDWSFHMGVPAFARGFIFDQRATSGNVVSAPSAKS